MGGVRVVGSRTRKGALRKGPSGRTGESCFSAFSNTSVPTECPANTLLPHTNLHRHRYSTPSPVPPRVCSLVHILTNDPEKRNFMYILQETCTQQLSQTSTHRDSRIVSKRATCSALSHGTHTYQVYTRRCGLTWHTPSMAQCKLPSIVIHAHTATVSWGQSLLHTQSTEA